MAQEIPLFSDSNQPLRRAEDEETETKETAEPPKQEQDVIEGDGGKAEEALEEWKEATEEHDKEWFAENGEAKQEETEEEAQETLEEWKAATEEHDKEFFNELEQQEQGEQAETNPVQGGDSPENPTDPDGETLEEIEEELQEEEEEAEIEDIAENEELDKEGFIDGMAQEDNTDEDEQEVIIPENTGDEVDAGEDAPNDELPEEENQSQPTPPPIDRTKVWTGEGVNSGVEERDDDDDDDKTQQNEQSPVPSPTTWHSPVAAPTPSAVVTECNPALGIPCSVQETYQNNPLVVLTLLAFLPLFLLCCCRRYFCRSKSAEDTRGEYRAVAARYGDMAFDNTFSDTLSDEEDDDFENGYGDIEDDSWGQSGKRSLEMSNLGNERDGGLSLEEMNG